MIYTRKIKEFKGHYAHFSKILLSFGCTDEKMDLRLYSDTYDKFSFFPKFKNRTLKSCNVSRSVFRISKSPDVGKHRKSGKSCFGPSVGPPDLIWVTLGQETYCRVAPPLTPQAFRYSPHAPPLAPVSIQVAESSGRAWGSGSNHGYIILYIYI